MEFFKTPPIRAKKIDIFLFAVWVVTVGGLPCWATPSESPDVLARRGKALGGSGTEKPQLTLTEPTGGWTSTQMITVAGKCSDPTADPVIAAINGVRYFIRVQDGAFSRKFPAARGENSVRVECSNKGGTASETRTIQGVMSPVRLKVVLTSDTDGVYTDLHLYEADGHHVYWASTDSPTGGLFFLNSQGESFDQPGYGPYLYVHPSPPVGVVRIDTNYWPGGAVQHTLANLDIVVDEGTPSEMRRRVRKPLARPGETQTLAYVVVRANGLPMKVFVPGQDKESEVPPEVTEYRKVIEAKIASAGNAEGEGEVTEGAEESGEAEAASGIQPAGLFQRGEDALRDAVLTVALAQAKKVSARWQPEQRDCAGLVRFAYREAVMPRTAEQAQYLPKGVHLPAVPFDARRFAPMFPRMWSVGYSSTGENVLGSYADAETLLGFNFIRKGGDLKSARTGDLLAFRRETETGDSFHLMIYGKADRSEGRDVVVYHTGSEPESLPYRAGFFRSKESTSVRIVPASDLEHAADALWRPHLNNPYFLGVFEWKYFNQKSNLMASAQL